MTVGFWGKLYSTGKPVLGLSPMDGVTDAPMRYMTAKYGNPDLLFSEFVSVDALAHAKEEKSVARLMKTFLRAQDVGELDHKPYEIAQVFGNKPELFYQVAVMIATLGFDGMDINMGCPAHKVEEQGSGAGLIRTPEIAKEIVRQAKRGMADYASGKVSIDDTSMSEAIKSWVKRQAKIGRARVLLPVSVKTRIGVDSEVVEEWMGHLMEVEPANISLHGRTLRQLYQGSADWEAIGRAARVVHSHGGHILGNGDIQDLAEAMAKIEQYRVDGVLIGRSAEGNPGIFNSQITNDKFSNEKPSMEQRLAWMVEHTKKFEKIFKPAYPPSLDELRKGTRQEQWFLPVRKHLAWYCKGFPGAGEMRSKLMLTNSTSEVERVVSEVLG